MTDDTYNGWVNRETWAADLHLSNDQNLYNLCRDMAEGALEAAAGEELVVNGAIERRNMARHLMADALKDMVETWAENVRLTALGETPPTARMLKEAVEMVMDVGSLYRVNWDDVARDYIDTAIDEGGK